MQVLEVEPSTDVACAFPFQNLLPFDSAGHDKQFEMTLSLTTRSSPPASRKCTSVLATHARISSSARRSLFAEGWLRGAVQVSKWGGAYAVESGLLLV